MPMHEKLSFCRAVMKDMIKNVVAFDVIDQAQAFRRLNEYRWDLAMTSHVSRHAAYYFTECRQTVRSIRGEMRNCGAYDPVAARWQQTVEAISACAHKITGDKQRLAWLDQSPRRRMSPYRVQLRWVELVQKEGIAITTYGKHRLLTLSAKRIGDAHLEGTGVTAWSVTAARYMSGKGEWHRKEGYVFLCGPEGHQSATFSPSFISGLASAKRRVIASVFDVMEKVQ